jgi:4-hydroxybenzoate polyprenyltransferase
MIGVFFFCYKHTKKIWKGIGGSLVGYFLIWFHLSLPGILMTLDPRTFSTDSIEAYFSSIYSGSFMSSIHSYFAFQVPQIFHYFEFVALFNGRICFVISLTGFLIIMWMHNKQKMRAFLRNIRPARIGLNILFVALGMKLAYWLGLVSHTFSLTDVFGLFVLAIVIGLNFILAVIINDRNDVTIDMHSNTDRPLIQKTLTDEDMKNILYILTAFVFMGGLLFNYNIFILLVTYQVSYFMYSVPPIRMRRIFLANSVIIGFVSVLDLLIGFFFVSQNQQIVSFPGMILFVFFIFIFSISPAKDLKDVAGDSSGGVTTLPSILGYKKSRLAIGLIMLAWLALFIIIALSYSIVIAFIYSMLFICAVIGLFFTKEGERGGFALLYLLIVPLLFL